MSKLVSPIDPAVVDLMERALEGYWDHKGDGIPESFVEYQTDQAGQGWGWARGVGRFFRPVLPFVKQGFRTLGKQAISTAGSLFGDISTGTNWREAGSQRFGEAHDSLSKKFRDKLSRMIGAGADDKTIHNAVKLFSFAPPAGVRGRARVTKRRRKKKTSAKSVPPATVSRRRLTRRASTRSVKRRKPTRRAAVRRRRVVRKRKPVQRGGSGGDYGFVF